MSASGALIGGYRPQLAVGTKGLLKRVRLTRALGTKAAKWAMNNSGPPTRDPIRADLRPLQYVSDAVVERSRDDGVVPSR